MIANLPWLLISVIIYNAIALTSGFDPTTPDALSPFDQKLLTLTMISGAEWTFTLGDLLIVITLIILFVELIKSTRTGTYSIVDHGLSMIVFIVCIIEFIAVRSAATSVFFIITVIVFIDVVAGFTITIKAAKRDVAFGADAH